MDATMALFWGSIELIKEELDTAREVADSRMSCPHALCFAMFVSKTTKTPRHACDGDICVTVDSVFVWLNERWITGILQSHLTKHPFLPNRSLALHPSGFMLCWATESQRLTYALPSWWPKPHKKYAEKFLGPDELPVYQEKIKDPPVSGLFLKPLNEITCAEAALLLNSTLCARVQVTPELQRKCSRTAVERTHIASIPPSSSPALFSPSVVPHKDSSSSSSSSDTSSTPLSPLVPSSDELSSRSLCRDSDDTPTASHANITAEGSSSTMITVTPTQGRSDCLQVEHTANTQMSDDLFHETLR
ncbi:hypothetical protein BC629DRAFT_920617 [Irpex lacteus]|nr:hypothetical protein BC629DRAFT_920617 [Irpex lacteus]